MSHYHRLPDTIDEEADALWDQLNDEQSREVQQHQSRFQAADPRSSRTNHWVIVQSMLWNTLLRTGAATTSAWHAAREAWRHPPRSAATSTGNTDLDWDVQFGIHDVRAEVEQPEQPNPGYPFVMLRQYPSRFAIQREQDHWGIVANMDVFLQNLYQYFYHRGIVPMICKFLVEFLSLIFTLWLSRILLQKVNWHQLVMCKDEHSCHANWSDYYYQQPLDSWTHWWLVQGYTLLFLAYATYSVWNFWQSLKQAWKCQFIMHEKLGISRRKLLGGAVAWDTVVEQLCRAQDSGEYRTALSRLDPLVIAQRIMRKDNFLIAFWNQRLLDVQIGQRQYWCPTLEWSIHLCVLNFMFNHRYELRPAFVLDVQSLERRFIVCGIVHALLLPFLLLFVSLHFLFRNVYDFKTQKQYMGNRQWSSVAQWTFREFNELPHVFERRMEPSYSASEQYLKLFGQSEFLAALGKLLVFLGGAVGGLLLVLGVVSDAILLHVQLWGRNLLWYAGMAGIVYSFGKGLLPIKEAQPSVTRNLFADMDAALKTVSTHTHHYPEHWKGRGWDRNVHSQFSMLFDSKVKLFLWELISLILAPYILIVRLSKCAPAICEFCTTIKAKVPGSGDVCGYSTFDFDVFRDEAWDGKTLGQSIANEPIAPGVSLTESILKKGNLEEATRQHPKPKCKNGKMEKSFFGFKTSHPSWICSPSGQHLVDRVEEYRQAELAALGRERDLYIAAAARQLETLGQLEDRSTTKPEERLEQERLYNYSHTPGSPRDDADAGTHPSPRLRPTAVSSTCTSDPYSSRSMTSGGICSSQPSSSHFSRINNFDPENGTLPLAVGKTYGLHLSHSLHEAALHHSLSDSWKQSSPSVSHRAGIANELRRLSTTVEPVDGMMNPLYEAADDRSRQYYWLERFHEHVEQQEADSKNGGNDTTPSDSYPASSGLMSMDNTTGSLPEQNFQTGHSKH